MLNLLIAMLQHTSPTLKSTALLYWITPVLVVMAQLLFGSSWIHQPVIQAQQETPVKIDSPRAEDVLQGVVSINGSLPADGFRAAEVDFSYQSDPTGSWFIIQPVPAPITGGLLAKWDTTTINDGEYRLRVQVILQDGQVVQAVVDNLRVRNYTQVETRTPHESSANGPSVLPTPTATPLADFVPGIESISGMARVTELPTNPAQFTRQRLETSALQGVLVVVGGLLVAGVYLGLRVMTRR